jgi:NAD(P)-dependent dehydrogenase (short-subunit alcohol dehydrogenase family)
MNDHFKVNVLGPLALFQATESLLRHSGPSADDKARGKFVVISSLAGSTTELQTFPMGVYSTSKAAVNHLTLKLQQENPDLTIFPIWYVLLPDVR